MSKNLFLQICEALHVPHTRAFTDRTFDEHPYKYSLFGLSRMLTDYGVENRGVRFSDKAAALAELETPFVAQVSGDLALVLTIADDEVTYRWYDHNVHVSRDQFLDMWSGVVLIVAPDDNSCEPHYAEHRHEEQIQNVKKWGVIGCIALILLFLLIRQASLVTSLTGEVPRPRLSLFIFHFSLFILNLAGLYLSYLLLLRQLKIASSTADRLCNLLKHSTCTDILDTPAAQVAYGISWSEIGAAYFAVNALVLVLLPQALPVLAPFAFGAVGYVVWSLWYQRFRAHAWCTLCLLVQAVFILQATTYLAYILHSRSGLEEYTHFSPFTLSLFTFFLLSYLAATLTLHLSLPIISKARQAEQWRSDFRNFKLREEVFEAILSKEKHYDAEASSSILFGDPNAPYRLTILTNPYCNPCAAMHARMSGCRQTGCCVEMVFSSFGETYDRVCRLMIAAYLQLGPDRSWQLYEEWYAGGKTKRETFFDGLGLDESANNVLEEYGLHLAWRKRTGLSVTPALLVNGYCMPKSYNIEDLKALINIYP